MKRRPRPRTHGGLPTEELDRLVAITCADQPWEGDPPAQAAARADAEQRLTAANLEPGEQIAAIIRTTPAPPSHRGRRGSLTRFPGHLI